MTRRERLWRAIVDRLPEHRRYPILSGPLIGETWWLSRHVSPHGTADYGYLSGRYEPENVRAFSTLVLPDDVVFDIGAHHGYYSKLAFHLGASRVYAFEPDQGALPSLIHNVPRAHIYPCTFQRVHLQLLDAPDVVKIDVDGDDAEVMAALYRWFPRPRAILVFH